MKMKNITPATMSFIALLGFTNSFLAAEGTTTEKKTVTIINAESSADGSTQLGREALKECIVSLPKLEAFEPVVSADSKYLKGINGEEGKNDWARVYSAKITLNYMVYRSDLLIVATKTIEGKSPVMKDLDKQLPRSQDFFSNPANGDLFAGRSHREYYFSKPDDAIKDVRSQAQVWLGAQKSLLCPDKH